MIEKIEGVEYVAAVKQPKADGDKPDFSLPLKALATMMALNPKRGESGTFPCPKCQRPFHWNYHGPKAIRGSCEAPDCLSFMS